MPIRIIEDVGAPVAVTAIDLITLEFKPDWNEWADYIMAGVGYVGGALGLGGRNVEGFLLNMGKAALPLAARAIRERVKGGATHRVASSRFVLRQPVQTPVSRSYQPEFEPVSPSAF